MSCSVLYSSGRCMRMKARSCLNVFKHPLHVSPSKPPCDWATVSTRRRTCTHIPLQKHTSCWWAAQLLYHRCAQGVFSSESWTPSLAPCTGTQQGLRALACKTRQPRRWINSWKSTKRRAATPSICGGHPLASPCSFSLKKMNHGRENW